MTIDNVSVSSTFGKIDCFIFAKKTKDDTELEHCDKILDRAYNIRPIEIQSVMEQFTTVL